VLMVDSGDVIMENSDDADDDADADDDDVDEGNEGVVSLDADDVASVSASTGQSNDQKLNS